MLEGSELNKVLRPDVTSLEMLAQVHKPIVSISCLNTIAESLWPVSKELVECSKVILIQIGALSGSHPEEGDIY